MIEPYEQYETFGQEFHEIEINPKRQLVLVSEDDDEKVYKSLSDDREFKPVEYPSLYYSKSSPYGSLYCLCIHDRTPFFISALREKAIERFNERMNKLGYLIPFDEFIQNTLHIRVESVTISQAKTLLKFANLIQSRKFMLSEDETKAQEQLKTKVYKIK